MSAAVKPIPVPTGPLYKELDYFEESDRSIFAGRQREIGQVVARISTQRCLVLYGRSGLGKTSLLRAGVFPELSERGFCPIYVRTLEAPVQDLHNAVLAAAGLSESREDVASLLRRIDDTAVPVIVLDQFEEFFIRFGDAPDTRTQFIASLTALIRDPTCDFRLVFSLREEYLAALDGFQKELPDLFNEALRLGPLTAFAAREAIVAPLIRNGITYDERLISKLVDELAVFEFDSARLQVTCAELCEAALSQHAELRHLSLDDFQQLEKVLHAPETTNPSARLDPQAATRRVSVLDGVFRRYLTRKIATVQAQSPTLARLILEVMITRELTKYAISWSGLMDYRFDEPDQVRGVLDKLKEGKIIRRGLRGAEEWYELRHECLVPEIRRWLAEDEDFRNFQGIRGLVQTGTDNFFNYMDIGALLTAQQMERVTRHRVRLGVTRPQCEFLFRSAIDTGMASEVDHWATRLGRADARKIVCSLLRAPKPSEESLKAARVFLDAPDSLAADALHVALAADNPAPVRSAAGGAFAELATKQELQTFARQLPLFRPSSVQKGVMADLADAGKVDELSLVRRVKARRYAARRTANEYLKAAADTWTLPPWMIGMFAALAWVPFGAFPLVALLMIYFLNDSVLLSVARVGVIFMVGSAIAIATAAVLGPFLGWRITRAGAAALARGGDAHWERAILRSGAAVALFCIPPLIALWVWADEMSSSQSDNPDMTRYVLMMLGGAVVLVLAMRYVVHWVVRFATVRTPPSRQLWQALIVPTLASHSFIVMLPLLVLYVLDWAWANDASTDVLQYVCLVLFTAQAAMSLLATVAAATLAQYAPASRRRLWSWPGRTVVGLLVGCSIAGASFFLVNREFAAPVAIPRPAQPRYYDANGAAHIANAFSHWPQVLHWTMQVSPRTSLVQAQASFFVGLTTPIEHYLYFSRSGSVQVAPDGVAHFYVSNLYSSVGESNLDLTVQRVDAASCESGHTVAAEGTVYLCRMLSDGRGGWRLRYVGRVPAETTAISLDIPRTEAQGSLRRLDIVGGESVATSAQVVLGAGGVLHQTYGREYYNTAPRCIEQPASSDDVELEFRIAGPAISARERVPDPPYLVFAVSPVGAGSDPTSSPCRDSLQGLLQ